MSKNDQRKLVITGISQGLQLGDSSFIRHMSYCSECERFDLMKRQSLGFKQQPYKLGPVCLLLFWKCPITINDICTYAEINAIVSYPQSDMRYI